MDGEYEDESRVGSRLGAQKNDYISWFKEYRRYDTDDQQELEELVEDDFELMVRAANQHGLSLYEAALFQSYLEENNGYDNSLKFAKQYASGDTSIPSPWEDKPLWDRFPDARKGSRRLEGYSEDESRVGSRLGAQKNDYISWFKEYRRYDTDDQQELEELVEDDFELMVRAANQHGLSLYEAALFQSYLEENNGYDNSLKFAKQYASGDTSIPSPWEDKPLWDRFPDARKGSRRGDALAQQIIGDNVEEDSDGYNFYDARNALRLEGYSEDEIEDNIDTWMYQHMN